MSSSEMKSFGRVAGREKLIALETRELNRFDNSVKAFALMLICTTMRRLLARTQTWLFIFIKSYCVVSLFEKGQLGTSILPLRLVELKEAL